MRRTPRLAMAVCLPAIALPLGAGAAAAPGVPTQALPSGLDVAVPYQGQTVCDPRPRPGVLAFARLMTGFYRMGDTSLIGRACTAASSEHYDGRAWDWMLNVNNPAQEQVAQTVLRWLVAPDAQGRPGAMARRFGIMYIIHNRKMWRAYAPERGWAPYYGASPHTDHIHFSFTYDGAAGRTSWWTGVPTTSYLTALPPAATTMPSRSTTRPSTPAPSASVFPTSSALSFGMTSASVKALQAKLGSLPTTGYFGPMTKARVLAYQRQVGLPQTGVADVRMQQWLASKGWVRVPSTVSSAAIAGASVARSALSTVSTDTPLTGFTHLVLAPGASGAAVRALQRALRTLAVDGRYGPVTAERVAAVQRAGGLPANGVVDPQTWRAVERLAYPFLDARTRVLRPGDTGEAVAQVQQVLGLAPSGTYDAQTVAAVKAAQQRAGLASTGIVASRTWQLFDRLATSVAA